MLAKYWLEYFEFEHISWTAVLGRRRMCLVGEHVSALPCASVDTEIYGILWIFVEIWIHSLVRIYLWPGRDYLFLFCEVCFQNAFQ